MTSAQPEESRERDQDRQVFEPGVEISSENFVVCLTARDASDPYIIYELSRLNADNSRERIQYASSYWFIELVDALEFVERKIRREGVERGAQVLGDCVGVRVSYDHDESTDEETLTAKLMTQDDENWFQAGVNFDPSLVSELRQLTSEVLDAMREQAVPDRNGYGFEFKVTD